MAQSPESQSGRHIERDLPQVPERVQEPFRRIVRIAAEAWCASLQDRLVSLVLFGSVARAQGRATSDIDILIIANDLPRSFRERRQPLIGAWSNVRSAHGLGAVEWNLVVKSPEEAEHHSPLYLDLVEEGIILFDRDRFFETILRRMKERMRALGSRRIFLENGSWYWDLKPDYRFGEVVEV